MVASKQKQRNQDEMQVVFIKEEQSRNRQGNAPTVFSLGPRQAPIVSTEKWRDTATQHPPTSAWKASCLLETSIDKQSLLLSGWKKN